MPRWMSRVRVSSSAPHAPLAQLVEHLTLNQGVRGSSPRWCTNIPPQRGILVYSRGLRILCAVRRKQGALSRAFRPECERRKAALPPKYPPMVYRDQIIRNPVSGNFYYVRRSPDCRAFMQIVVNGRTLTSDMIQTPLDVAAKICRRRIDISSPNGRGYSSKKQNFPICGVPYSKSSGIRSGRFSYRIFTVIRYKPYAAVIPLRRIVYRRSRRRRISLCTSAFRRGSRRSRD